MAKMYRFISPYRNRNGFTLIELMVTIAIIAILAGVALPSYQKFVMRGKRASAQAEMMSIANLEQQYFLANRVYLNKADLISTMGYALPSSVSSAYSYDVTTGTGSVPSFTITFNATGSQTGDGNLTLDSAGNKTPAGKW